MPAIIKWTIRSYLALKTLKAIGQARGRTAEQNIDALLTTVDDTKEAIMNLSSSPSASLNPSRQSARNTSRSQTSGPVRTATTALLGAAGTEALSIHRDDTTWTLTLNQDGDLVGTSNDGRHKNFTADAEKTEVEEFPTTESVTTPHSTAESVASNETTPPTDPTPTVRGTLNRNHMSANPDRTGKTP